MHIPHLGIVVEIFAPIYYFNHFKKGGRMTNLGLMVRLEAKKGKEAEVERFLKDGLNIVNNERDTITWYALKLGPSTYGIFDTFNDTKGRESHLNGEIAKTLNKRTNELFARSPIIEKVDVLAAKLPEMEHH